MSNAFRYRVFFMFLDLSRIEELSGVHPFWSGAGKNLAYFRRKDYMGDPEKSLDSTVREYVFKKTGVSPRGPIRILTHLRYFGHCFNPVSFYYCYDENDENLTTVVVEITNTPWKEKFIYLFPVGESEHALPDWRQHRFKKAFHVSPFMDMDIHYDWRFRVPGEKLNVHMINYKKGGRFFDASLSLKRKPLTRHNMTRMLLLHPLMTVKVVFYIYWQALKLQIKGTPFYSHP